jgi:hypothetical protein
VFVFTHAFAGMLGASKFSVPESEMLFPMPGAPVDGNASVVVFGETVVRSLHSFSLTGHKIGVSLITSAVSHVVGSGTACAIAGDCAIGFRLKNPLRNKTRNALARSDNDFLMNLMVFLFLFVIRI